MAEVKNSMVQSKFPVLTPTIPELKLARADFDKYVAGLVGRHPDTVTPSEFTATKDAEKKEGAPATKSAFMTGLLTDDASVSHLEGHDGSMLTENGDVTYFESRSPLVDLFYEMENGISGSRLQQVLEKAWKVDRDATLKIIWNARSIHLGKSDRHSFYRAIGWLYHNHPASLIVNLPWLVRPIIRKKLRKAENKKDVSATDKIKEKLEDIEIIQEVDYDSDFTMPDDEMAAAPGESHAKKRKIVEDRKVSEFDIKHGASHGYWKDLLNILALAANDKLSVNGDIRSVLNPEKPTGKPHRRNWTAGRKKDTDLERHKVAMSKLAEDKTYKALHMMVARLFADQLKADVDRLQSGNIADTKSITLCGKWAPSNKGMHDKHTCIVSSIAEVLYPFDDDPSSDAPADRVSHLQRARNSYQTFTLSRLRKYLEVVERDISSNNFENIKYDRVPSLAMRQHTPLFAKKDSERFEGYIEKVVAGQANISGAVLLPSTLIAQARDRTGFSAQKAMKNKCPGNYLHIQDKVASGQWSTLVQRIKDSGNLESSIAVCDVSGSMCSPRFPDGTCPMDSSIGLSLLIAEVTKPPFGGAFITFSEDPEVVKVGGTDDKRTLKEKVNHIEESNWGMTTDFEAVFTRLILPMALRNKLKQEDMVKQVFVFSDMHFNGAAQDPEGYRSPSTAYERNNRWATSYERIKAEYQKHGYQMPKLIFWNLAGGHHSRSPDLDNPDTENVAPKPVDAYEENTTLASGYSQGQLKMFLDGGGFEDPEEEEVVETRDEETGEVTVEKKKKAPDDPLAMVKKAISHEAYRMLKVVD